MGADLLPALVPASHPILDGSQFGQALLGAHASHQEFAHTRHQSVHLTRGHADSLLLRRHGDRVKGRGGDCFTLWRLCVPVSPCHHVPPNGRLQLSQQLLALFPGQAFAPQVSGHRFPQSVQGRQEHVEQLRRRRQLPSLDSTQDVLQLVGDDFDVLDTHCPGCPFDAVGSAEELC